MAYKNEDETDTELTGARRKRRPKKVLPKPLLRLLAVLAVIIVVVVVIVVTARSALRGGEAADYQRYMTEVASLMKQSDALGQELSTLLTEPGDTNRKDIQTRLDRLVVTSAKLADETLALEAPNDLVKNGVHQFLVLIMTFRKDGLADLKPSLMNALEVQDTEVTAEQISHALSYLTNSDFLYDEVFVPRVTEVLKAKELTGITVPSSDFLADHDLASKAKVQEIVAKLKSIGNLQAVHGVALKKLVASPDEVEIKGGNTYNLTASDEFALLVTVENQGNMAEKDVPITVTLLSPSTVEPQTVQATIPELKPGETVTATVEGIDPTPYGEVGQLRVQVGPVPGEKVQDNNWLEAKIIFKL
jgi:hypothetical protein